MIKKGFFNCLYNIVITQNNATRISQLKEHLFNHIQIKDFGFWNTLLVLKLFSQKKVW